jgi:hypothetical protein
MGVNSFGITNLNEELTIELQGTKQELMARIPLLMDAYDLYSQMNERNLYTIPVTTFQDKYTFHPQICLVFYEMSDEAIAPNRRVHGEISYRIMGETEETLSENNARVRAERIKNLFVNPTLFEWQKGREIVTYRDQRNGYDFRLRVKSETEARRIITQIMGIEGKTPEWQRLTVHESRAAFPENPGSKRIYGEMRQLPVRRPVRDIKFRYAELHLWGVPKPVTLVDTTGRRGKSLIRAW